MSMAGSTPPQQTYNALVSYGAVFPFDRTLREAGDEWAHQWAKLLAAAAANTPHE